MTRSSSRRAVLAGACAACAATLAGCARYSTAHGLAGPPGQPAYGAPSTGAATASGAAPTVLATTAEIPVGGGKVLTAQKIVITQPQAGTYHAFTAICTHQGCIVNAVSGGTINCPCHGSEYSIVNGSVVRGPAPLPLAAVAIKVEGTSILQG
jgi:Rieske Fe-S protein